MNNQLQVGIFGVGAIGSVVASLLYENKKLFLYYYNKSTRDSIKLNKGKSIVEFPIKFQSKTDSIPSLDWLIICLKEYHFHSAKSHLKTLINPLTKVVVIRNGLRLKEPILEFTSAKNILECQIDCPVQTIEKGFYEQLKKPVLSVPFRTLTEQFTQLFSTKNQSIRKVSDFKTACWMKLCESSAIGAILCLSGETAWIFKDLKIRNLYRKILEEGVKVANADGAKISNNYIEDMLDKLQTYPQHKSSSMLSDRKNGHPIELGAKNGIISSIGKLHKINTPLNDLVCDLLQFTNQPHHSTLD